MKSLTEKTEEDAEWSHLQWKDFIPFYGICHFEGRAPSDKIEAFNPFSRIPTKEILTRKENRNYNIMMTTQLIEGVILFAGFTFLPQLLDKYFPLQ